MESHKRSIIKAITWRVIASLIIFVIAYLFTKEVVLSVGIGISDTIVKIVTYYFHERMWNKIDFGREKRDEEDYSI